MDVKTTFLNFDLEEEVYMKQPEGFVMLGNEHKMCKLVKLLYRLKQAPKQWHQKFDEVVLSSGFLLNQSDKCVYSKFDISSKGVIICLYVDEMLIFGTDQNQIDKTKVFIIKVLMKDMEKQTLFLGKPVDQLEYSRVIGCLMYAMTSTRPDIAYAVDASWINHVEDSSSTSGWVFYVGEVVSIYGLRKQIMIFAPTMAKAYSKLYNGKSRHLGVRHSMVRELIRNSVISIEFVWTQHNLADHLTKGLARDLLRLEQVYISSEVQELKGPNLCEHEVLPLQEAWLASLL
ncbi:zinc finger, CCHC-type containing protein [Tanacetum coccineum]